MFANISTFRYLLFILLLIHFTNPQVQLSHCLLNLRITEVSSVIVFVMLEHVVVVIFGFDVHLPTVVALVALGVVPVCHKALHLFAMLARLIDP